MGDRHDPSHLGNVAVALHGRPSRSVASRKCSGRPSWATGTIFVPPKVDRRTSAYRSRMRRAWIAAGIFAAIFTALAAYRWQIWSFGSDTGTFTQAVLDAGNGFRNGPEHGSH